MCGRYVSTSTPDKIAEYFGADTDVEPLAPSTNVAPTNDVYGIVADADGGRHVAVFHWGLVPVWAKDTKIGSKMINARAETLTEKRTFTSLFRSRRCIVPMDGFYEWQTMPSGLGTGPGRPAKQPMYIHRVDGSPLAVAGLWTAWRDKGAGPEAPWLHSLTVITTDANELMASVHDRMPAILEREDWEAWLDRANDDVEALAALLGPAHEATLTMYPVSTAVNNVRNKGPELTEPLPPG